MLGASTRAGKTYNAVIFGAILLSVLALLLEPDPLGNSALRQTNVPWIDLVQNVCLAMFAADFVLIWPWRRSLAVTCSASPD